MGSLHFADKANDGNSLCGEEGRTTYTSRRVDCAECIRLLPILRRERKMVELAQIQAIVKPRLKLKQRIERAKERRTPMAIRT